MCVVRLPELQHHCPNSAVILVGTKSDLRSQVSNPITEQEGKKLKSKIKANSFLQCSAKTGDGIDAVFVESVRAVMKQNSRGKNRFCPLL